MNPAHIALRNPISVLILVVMICAFGSMAYLTLPREAAPDIQVPILVVTFPYPGASPEDVEDLVTRKVEKKLKDLKSLKKITSVSSEGASTITLRFQLGFDVQDVRTKTREKLNEVKPELPSDVKEPILTEINLSEEPIQIITLSGEVGLDTLKNVGEDLQEEIEGVPGILSVNLRGGLKREVHVYVDPEKLAHYNLSLNRVSDVVAKENANIPGGSLETGPKKYLIRAPAKYKNPQEIGEVVVAHVNNSPIYVRDVARVQFAYQDQTSRARTNGKESVSLSVIKRSGENLLKISEQVRALVTEYQSAYEGQITFSIRAEKSKSVQRMVTDLENNVITGFLLVGSVLMLVMGFRNAMFVAAAIPFSFLLALIVMSVLSYTLNFVVLFALILALGMLVDNAIVVVENIYRHVQSGKPRGEAAYQGISEVSVPIFTSTLTTLVAFAPLLFMPGIVGQFLSYLPKTLIFALSASLAVGLIINPVLCSLFMKQKRSKQGNAPAGHNPQQASDNTSLDEVQEVAREGIKKVYANWLEGALRFRWLVLGGGVLLFVFVLGLYASTTLKKRGVEFFPTTEPETVRITLSAASGTTLDVSERNVIQAEGEMEPYQSSIASMVSNVGGSNRGARGGHFSRTTLEFPEWQDWDMRPSEVVPLLREAIANIPGVEVQFQLGQAGPPTGAPVNIEIAGDDYDDLVQVADEIKSRIENVPGLVNLDDDFERNVREIQVLIDREKIARIGLNTTQVSNLIRTAFNGRNVSTYREGKEEYDIVVRLDSPFRASQQDLERLYLFGNNGQRVPLRDVSTIQTSSALGLIRHTNQDRVISVTADAEGIPGPVLLQKVQQRLADYQLPANTSLRYTGAREDQEESQSFLMQSFVAALFMIFLVLVTQFNSVLMPFVILSAVMLSLIGVFMGLMIHDRPFSIMMGGIGIISLAGIVVNNAIVLIDFINQLRKRGYSRDEAVVLAGMIRLRPVLLTAITTVLGLMPVAAGMDINFYRWPIVIFGSASGTFWVPMALSVVYGLSAATFLTLFFVPTLYSTLELIKENRTRFFYWIGTKLTKLTRRRRLFQGF